MFSRLFHRRSVPAAAVVLSALLPVSVAWAQQPPMQGQPAHRPQMQERAGMVAQAGPREAERSLSDAVRRVQRTTGGHILGAERVPFDGRDINRVKYMDERGRVRYMDDPVQQRSQPRTPRSDISSLRGDNP